MLGTRSKNSGIGRIDIAFLALLLLYGVTAIAADDGDPDVLLSEGKEALRLSDTDSHAVVTAASKFAAAALLFEARNDSEKTVQANSFLYWCKKKMTLKEIDDFVATQNDASKKLAQVDQAISKDEAQSFYDRAEKFAADNPNENLAIAVRYFEVADRFAGTETSLKAQKKSLEAQQKALKSAPRTPAVNPEKQKTIWISQNATYEASSTVGNYSPSPALLNGRTPPYRSPGENDGFCFHTDPNVDKTPSIVIDLGRAYSICHVDVVNRKLAKFFSRAKTLTLWVGNEKAGPWTEVWHTDDGEATWAIDLAPTEPARFVKMGLRETDSLHLSSVKIFANAIPPPGRAEGKQPAIDATEKAKTQYDDAVAKARDRFLKALKHALDAETKKGNLDGALVFKNEAERLSDPQATTSTVELKGPEAIYSQRVFSTEILTAKKAYIAAMHRAAREETTKKNLDKAMHISDEIRAFVGAPSDSVEFQGHYYKTVAGGYTWSEAKKLCEENGGYLVCIETKEEEDFLEATFFTGEHAGNAAYWIGMHQDEQRQWVWVNGAPSSYRKFHAGEPNGSGKSISIVRNSKQWGETVGWDDTNERQWFACEWGY